MQPPTHYDQKICLEPDTWEFTLDDLNVLVLDRADCSAHIKGQETHKAHQREILRIDNDLRNHFNIEPRGGYMIQPWVHQDKPLGPSANIVLDYQIHIETLPAMPVFLALEQPERWDIRINKHLVNTKCSSDGWIDPAIRMLPLANNLFCLGQNRLTLTGKFDRQTNLESLYLLGHFGVTLDGQSPSITQWPQHLTLGNWGNQGLPFFFTVAIRPTAHNLSVIPNLTRDILSIFPITTHRWWK